MTTVVFPSILAPSSASWRLRALTQTHTSPFDGSTQTLALPGARWEASLSWSTLPTAQARTLAAWLAARQGRAGRFRFGPYQAMMGRLAAGIAGRTNVLRNSRGNGAPTNGIVPNTSSTTTNLPTNWQIIGTVPSGLTLTCVGAVTVDGLSGVRFSLAGTPSSTAAWTLAVERSSAANGGPAAVAGQVWAGAASVRVVSGSLSNIGVFAWRLNARTAAGATVGNADQSIGTPATLTRIGQTYTAPATTGVMVPGIVFAHANTTAAVSLTFDLVAPQLERASAATAYIETTTGPVTVQEGPYLNGAGQSGETLALRGWLADADAFRAGDWLSYLDTTGRARLHQVTADVVADGVGLASVPIVPPIRRAGADGAAVEVLAPFGFFHLAEDAVDISIRPPLFGSASFEIVEALA